MPTTLAASKTALKLMSMPARSLRIVTPPTLYNDIRHKNVQDGLG
jgi:hypothetical protein